MTTGIRSIAITWARRLLQIVFLAAACGVAAAQEPVEPVLAPVLSRGPRIGRNDPCTCGSGKKFKKCCGARK